MGNEPSKMNFRISDIYTAAFLVLSGLQYTLAKKDDRIMFCFSDSAELYRRLQEFNEGIHVDVAEFSREVKRLRAIMLEAKRGAER